MLWLRMFIPTLREASVREDGVLGHGRAASLLVRAGYALIEGGKVRDYLPLGTRSLRRITGLLRKRLVSNGGQEFVLSGETLENGEEFDSMTRGTRSDRPGHSGVVPNGIRQASHAPSERRILQIAASRLQSYRELPQLWFDFARSSSGQRCRIYFLASSDERNDPAEEAISHVVRDCGLTPVAARSLPQPGREESAAALLCPSPDGDVEIARCACGYAASLGCAVSRVEEDTPDEASSHQPQLVQTPGKRTIADVCEFLDLPSASVIKSLLYIVAGEPVLALVRGDDQLNERLLCHALASSDARPADIHEVLSLFGAEPGSIGPVGTKRVRILADRAIRSSRNMVCGANRDDYHLTGVEPKRDFHAEYFPLRQVGSGDPCPECGQPLVTEHARCLMRSAKLSHGCRELAAPRVLGPDNQPQTVCVSTCAFSLDALLMAAIEQFSDKEGIVLPAGIAPFDVVITPIKYADDIQRDICDRTYQRLADAGIDVLLDDRDASPGAKFKDADLIGASLRITVGPRNLREGKVELRIRATGDTRDVPVESVLPEVTQVLCSTR